MVLAEYLRLSLEDEVSDFAGKKYESESISNQRTLITDYLLSCDEFKDYEVREFVDDGRSGTNMERPGFQSLMKSAMQGEVDVIIVKDLSRIGRNYIEVGNILEQELPSMDVRVIAINDNFDSSAYEGTTAGMAVIIKMMTYDLYSKQLSHKVRQAQYRLMEEGRYVNVPPYGYMPEEGNKHHLVIDEAPADIVRLIFKKIIAGFSTSEVACLLNEKGVAPPSVYKGVKKKNPKFNKNPLWTHSVIVDIIRNEKYCGAMVYHKRKKMKVSDLHEMRTDKKDWLIVEDTHEPIVSREEFERAQEALRKVRKHTKKKPARQDNVFFCPYCGYRLRRTYGRDVYLSCSHQPYTDNEDCKKIYWAKSDMDAALRKAFELQIELFMEENQQRDTHKISQEALKRKKSKISYLSKGKSALKRRKMDLYEQYREGEMDKETFRKSKDKYADEEIRIGKELEQAERELSDLNQAIQQAQIRERNVICAEKLLRQPIDAQKEVMYNFIAKVMVYDNERIKIEWNFDDFSLLMQ